VFFLMYVHLLPQLANMQSLKHRFAVFITLNLITKKYEDQQPNLHLTFQSELQRSKLHNKRRGTLLLKLESETS
jgi:protoheme ferro-lyase